VFEVVSLWLLIKLLNACMFDHKPNRYVHVARNSLYLAQTTCSRKWYVQLLNYIII